MVSALQRGFMFMEEEEEVFGGGFVWRKSAYSAGSMLQSTAVWALQRHSGNSLWSYSQVEVQTGVAELLGFPPVSRPA